MPDSVARMVSKWESEKELSRENKGRAGLRQGCTVVGESARQGHHACVGNIKI